jgi:hypothetical protein
LWTDAAHSIAINVWPPRLVQRRQDVGPLNRGQNIIEQSVKARRFDFVEQTLLRRRYRQTRPEDARRRRGILIQIVAPFSP